MPPPPQYGYAPNPGFYVLYQSPRPRRSRKSTILLVLAIVIYVLLFSACAAAVVLGGSFGEEPDPEPTASVGQQFFGTWKGHVTDEDSTWSVELTLHAGLRNGEVDYLDGRRKGWPFRPPGPPGS